jgi:hypothetical protein
MIKRRKQEPAMEQGKSANELKHGRGNTDCRSTSFDLFVLTMTI